MNQLNIVLINSTEQKYAKNENHHIERCNLSCKKGVLCSIALNIYGSYVCKCLYIVCSFKKRIDGWKVQKEGKKETVGK